MQKFSEAFCFHDGSLMVKISGHGDSDGSGFIAFDDNALEYEPHEDNSGTTRFQNIPKSEMVALRDFLNRVLPDPAVKAVADERDALARDIAMRPHVLKLAYDIREALGWNKYTSLNIMPDRVKWLRRWAFAAPTLLNMVKWTVTHEGECLGDHQELLEPARALVAEFEGLPRP